MNKITVLCLLLFTITLRANDNNPTTIAQAEKWLSTANEKGFLENKGQMMDNEGKPVPQVLFKTEAPDLNIWVTQNGLTIQTLHLRKEPIPETELSEFEKEEVKRTGKAKTKKYFDWERVDIELKNATIKKENILKENPLQGHDNYFYPTCPDGIYGVKEYEKITIQDVYPGIDWVLYRNKDKGFKYDFVVHPEADYQQIELIYKSKTPININEQGELEMFTIYGNVKENKPVSFYENQEIATRFTQNYQKPTEIRGDNGYETSISFSLNTSLNTQHSTLIIDPQLTWATFYGGNVLDGPMSIDTDNNGNLFVGGYTLSTNFPVQDVGSFFQGTKGIYNDVFILKFDNNGNRLWATYYGGSGNDGGYSIAIDNIGDVFVTGYTNSSNFPVQDAGTFFQGIYDGGLSGIKWDTFILKFDSNGNRLWATYYGGSDDEKSASITIDYIGNVFVTGFTASTNFPIQNVGTFFQGIKSIGTDVFILKFDNAGNRLWATYYGGGHNDLGYSIATGNNGSVFVIGSTKSSNFPVQDVGSFFQGTKSGGGGTFDSFILKFDNAGNRLWATYYGGSGDDFGYSIDTDNNGYVIATGYTTSSNFPIQNSGTFFQGTLLGVSDIFILKFDNNSNRLWATYFGGSGNEIVSESNDVTDNLAITSCGKVYINFSTNSSILPFLPPCDVNGYFDNTFNGGNGNYGDNFLVLFSNSGNLLWSTYIGGDGSDFREALALDPNNNLFMAGEWTNQSGSINSVTYPVTNPGGGAYYDGTFNGNDDGYILKFTTNTCICSVCIDDTVTQNFIICQGESITVGTNNYNTTGTFIDTLTNILGCDSIITTNLTIKPTVTSTDVQIACDSIVWIDLIIYFMSTNTPTYTIVGGADSGCDSVVTLNLTINSNTVTDIQTACGSYVWIDGNTYTSSNNTATYTLINSLGCDSIVTLNLTINNTVTSTDIRTACNSYTWINGITYTASTTTPTFTLVGGATSGCDSVVTLNLTINTFVSSTDVQTACNSLTWIDGVTYTASTNTPTDTLVAANGCDSVVTLNLTINNQTSSTDIITACDSITWIDGITYSASTNSPTFTLTNISGCDSVVTLNLTINTNSSIDVITACDSITWIDGVTYTASTNTPTFTLTNISGCDSVVTLNLTINANSSTDVITACDSITWIDGNIYTVSTNSPTFTLTNTAGCDSMVTLNLTINNLTSSTDVITACDSITWIDGNTYTTSTNTPTFTLTNSVGCDSVVTLDLIINNPSSGIDTQTACESYTWINSVTYTVSTNIPTFTIVGGAANGCDSLVTLNLTINNSTISADVQTTCNSYVWIDGITYTANNNTATFTLTNSVGCDSVVTLDLTINNSTTSTDVQTACNTYTWIDGNAYSTNNNSATFTLSNSVGCDSVVTLNLTINNSTTNTDTQTACDSYTWIDGNTYSSSNNTATFILTNYLGCDSVVTLNLTIIDPVTTTQTFTECQGFSITVGSNTYTTTGVFTDGINGCDTMITNLTINDAPQFTLIKEDDNCGEHSGSVLVNVTSSIPPVTYVWNTGSSDSIISNLPAGTYTVTVNDGSGCSNVNTTSVLDLKLDCESFIFIPSVFTPNGDGQNDEFLIQLKGLEFISLEIYNRWGIKLFESTQLNKGWDGRTETDTNATDGTYFFIVSYKTTDDEIMTKKGTLTLLR